MTYYAEILGHAGVEIFPKQVSRKDGEIGNWINLPYFYAESTKRYAVRNKKPLALDQFLNIANSIALDEEAFEEECHRIPSKKIQEKGNKKKKQTLADRSEGRNTFLYKMGCKLYGSGLSEDTTDKAIDAINENASEDDHPNFKEGSLDQKEMKTIKKQYKKIDPDDHSNDYLGQMSESSAIEMMNEKFSICLEKGKLVIISIEFEDALNRYVTTRSSPTDIKNFYITPIECGIDANGNPKFKPLGEFWFKHPAALKYDGVVFIPGADIEGKLNLWRGFAVVPIKGDWSLLHKHIFENVCNSNQEYYDYFIKWIATMVQYPASPGHVAIVLKGGRGVGKSFVAKMIGQILGQHFLHISHSRYLVGNFNAHLEDCVFLFCDEAFWAGDKQGENAIKARITEEALPLERKGRDAYASANYNHIMMASNNDWIVPAGEDERRYFVLDVNDAQKQNHEYFQNIANQMDNGGAEALLYDLQNMDLSNFNVRKAPNTGALTEQKLRTMPAEAKWWYAKLQDGNLPPDYDGWACEIRCDYLFEDYANTLSIIGERRKSLETSLGISMRKFLPSIEKKHVWVPKEENPREQERKWVYKLPELEQARKDFESYLGSEIEWQERMPDTF